MSGTTNAQALTYIVSDKDSHFTTELAENAIEHEDISFPTDFSVQEIHELLIEHVTIQSDQNLEWDIFVWSGAENLNADLDLDEFTDYFNFPKSTGKQIAGTAQFYYASPSSTKLGIPYVDTDNTSKLHVSLVNRSSTNKAAGATGEVKVRFGVRPHFGV